MSEVKVKGRSWRRRLTIALRAIGVLLLVLLLLTLISTDRFRGFGGSPRGVTLARMQASPHFVNGEFRNDEATELMKAGSWDATKHWIWGEEMRVPTCPLPIVTGDELEARLASPPPTGLRITWLGHSTTLIEIDGFVLLTDPNWSERSSPSRWVGPTRFHPPPLSLEALDRLSASRHRRRIDAVLISHEHFDHLDMATVRALSSRGLTFHVPLGVPAHLEAWGVPPSQIVAHDWWESSKIAGGGADTTTLKIVSTPSRHFNGRGIPFRTGSFWTSWAIIGPKHRVFFSGDTGFEGAAFTEIAKREGPFDVAMLEIGQYHESWGDIHLGPAGALDAFEKLGAKTLFPIHWSTFQLAMHDWSEPAETLVREAERRSSFPKGALMTPKLGEPAEPTAERSTEWDRWWRTLPPIASRCP